MDVDEPADGVTQRIDLGGRTVVTGLIDAHTNLRCAAIATILTEIPLIDGDVVFERA